MIFDYIIGSDFYGKQAATAAELMEQNKRLLAQLLQDATFPAQDATFQEGKKDD